MNKILKKNWLSPETVFMIIEAPLVARAALPGHFVIVKVSKEGERIPLTIADYDKESGTISIIFHVIGKSTKKMSNFEQGDSFPDVVGPLGMPSEFIHLSDESLSSLNVLFIAGGVGIAPVYPQVKWWFSKGFPSDVILGARNKELVLLEEDVRKISSNLYVMTDDGGSGEKGLVTDKLIQLIETGKQKYDYVVAIGPMIMMKAVSDVTRKYGIKTIVSLNSMMVDGTGMCGACRVSIGKEVKFTCVDGPEFDGHLVDFAEAMRRQSMYRNVDVKKITEEKSDHSCTFDEVINLPKDSKRRVPISEQPASERVINFDEVCLGYSAEEAVLEAERCLQCKKPLCVAHCPVTVKIPEFIQQVANRNFEKAAEIIYSDSALPAICGRVCPQETQCEGACILGKKFEPIAIGKLERFVADWARKNNKSFIQLSNKKEIKTAVIGAGPAGLTCAGELAQMGYKVTVYEALHEAGGVLTYGIPDFRLPKEIVQYEIDQIKKLGVEIKTNVIIGKSMTISDLMQTEGYSAVFIGSGAGLPKFMSIPGENLNGVVSANEFLTRSILMRAYKEGYDTPLYVGKKVAVVGGGNVAMDAARTAKRLGAEVYVVYRRSETELPARIEEVHHAKEEGIQLLMLTNPVEILSSHDGWVRGLRCVKMTLGEPDASGRRSPSVLEGSEFDFEVDTVIMSLGTSPNPLIPSTTEGLSINKYKGIFADETNGNTSLEGVFAGGDAVTGSATVILAMGAGKKAAQAMDHYIKSKQ